MGHICWDFPLLGRGNEQGYTNSGIETFKGKELIENLAREICQNSLDAKDDHVDGPVIVSFTLREIDRNSHVVFSEYADCLHGCRENWLGRTDEHLGDFLSAAETMLESQKIPVLIASDYHTKGLEGVDALESEESPWRALTHSDGTSVAKSEDSAGSYGIGKNAPFACTALSMVFYNTYAIDGGRAFQGSSRLATIKKNGRKTQGVGHYLYIQDSASEENNVDDDWRPIKLDDGCSFLAEFEREEHGTDIIIVGFSETDHWVERMVRAIVANFFLAIYRGQLVVKVQDTVIDQTNLGTVIYQFKDAPTVDAKRVYEWYQALTNPDNGEPIYLSILEENDVSLYIKTDSEYHNQVASFRSSGMRIGIRGVRSYQSFAAVLVIEKEALSRLLRKAEPVRHNKWDATLINKKDNELRKKVKSILDQLDNWLRTELRKKYESAGASSQDSGEGDYLPDDESGAQLDQQGNDILRVKQKLGKSRSSIASSGSIGMGSGEGVGTPSPGDVYGKKKRKKKKKGKKVVTGSGSVPGTSPSKGGQPLSVVNLTSQKVFLINQKLGLYKVVIRAEQTYPKVLLSFYAIGEDAAEDLLAITKYAYNGVTKVINGNTVGPIAIESGESAELFITFDNKEKMRLNMLATEVKQND